MARTSTGRSSTGKVKSGAPAAPAREKAKAPGKNEKAKAPGKKAKAAIKKAPVKSVAPKMAQAPRKSSSAKPAAPVRSKGKTPKKAVAPAGIAVTAKTASASKIAGGARTAAKSVAVKKSAPRRPIPRKATPASATRQARPAVARSTPAAAASRKLSTRAAQSFTVSHLNEADFIADGLRSYARYRDLGIAAATGGLCQAHVIRLMPPCTDEVRKRHMHQTELQLLYVLKGWMKNEFEGHGEQMMSAGSCWLQPPGIKHTVLDYSADCEVLEIIVPADFNTDEVT